MKNEKRKKKRRDLPRASSVMDRPAHVLSYSTVSTMPMSQTWDDASKHQHANTPDARRKPSGVRRATTQHEYCSSQNSKLVHAETHTSAAMRGSSSTVVPVSAMRARPENKDTSPAIRTGYAFPRLLENPGRDVAGARADFEHNICWFQLDKVSAWPAWRRRGLCMLHTSALFTLMALLDSHSYGDHNAHVLAYSLT